MTLSKRGDYVVRSALCLARAAGDGESRKIREVVAEMDVPRTFASQILADLVHAELAVSKAGKDGGYRLARPADQITLLEVVEAGEGKLRAERCALGDGPCRWESVCPLHETWTAATAAMREVLANTTLEQVLQRDLALARGSVEPPPDSHRVRRLETFNVSDSVQIERAQSEVLAALGKEALLAEAVTSAYEQADLLRAQLVLSGLPWGAADSGHRPAISVAKPEGTDGPSSASSAGVAHTRQLAWEFAHSNVASSRFEGTVSVFAVDPERSDLHIEGRFRAPQPVGGVAPGDRAAAERVVRSLVRTFLREVAGALEREHTTAQV